MCSPPGPPATASHLDPAEQPLQAPPYWTHLQQQAQQQHAQQQIAHQQQAHLQSRAAEPEPVVPRAEATGPGEPQPEYPNYAGGK